jgi:WD40 repeat protein
MRRHFGIGLVLLILAGAAPALPPVEKETAKEGRTASVQAWEEQATLKAEALWRGVPVFSPDGRVLAVASGGFDVKTKKTSPHEVWIWDADKREVRHRLKGHDQPIVGLAFLAGGKKLVSVDGEGKVKWWDVAEGKELDGTALGGFASGVTFLPDGKTMVVRVERGAKPLRRLDIEVYDLTTGKKTDTLPRSAAQAVAFSPDLKLALLNKGTLDLSTDKTAIGSMRVKTELKLTDLSTDRDVATLWKQATAFPQFSPDGKAVAFATYSASARRGSLVVWDVAAKKPKGEPIAYSGGNLFSLTFSPDGKWLVAGTEDGAVKVWELANGKAVAALKGHSGAVRAVAVGPDGGLASVGADNTLRLWAPKKP